MQFIVWDISVTVEILSTKTFFFFKNSLLFELAMPAILLLWVWVDFKVFFSSSLQSFWQTLSRAAGKWQHVKSSIVESLGLLYSPYSGSRRNDSRRSPLIVIIPGVPIEGDADKRESRQGSSAEHNNLLIENSLKETLKMGIGKCNGYSRRRAHHWQLRRSSSKKDEFLSLR